MTEDLSIWGGQPLAVAMAVVLREHIVHAVELEAEVGELRQIVGDCYGAIGVENVGTLDETPGLIRARVAELQLRVYQMGEFAKDELNYEVDAIERMAATRRPKMPAKSGEGGVVKASIKKRVEVEVEFTPTELGEMFASLDGEQMAEFFNSIAEEVAKWELPFCFQMQYVTDATNLSKEARAILCTLGEYADEFAMPDQGGEGGDNAKA